MCVCSRLLCPLDNPGKNTGVSCHALPQGDLPNPGIKPMSLISPALANLFFTTGATWETPCLHLLPLPRIPFFDISVFHPLDTFTVWNVRTLELGYLGPNSGFVDMDHDHTYAYNTLCFVFNIFETKMDIVTASGVALRIKCVCVNYANMKDVNCVKDLESCLCYHKCHISINC